MADERIERYRAGVVAQANAAGADGWMEIPVAETVRPSGRLRVPRGAFERWAVRTTGGEHLAAPWSPVSPQGVKQGADDPYHTDWMLGAGLGPMDMRHDGPDPDLTKALNEAAYGAKARIEERLLGFRCSVLLSGPDVRGRVWHPKGPADVEVPWSEEPPVAVLRDARPDWLEVVAEVLGRGGAVVVERGGEMAHLVTLLRGEGRGPLVRVPGALRLYPEGLLLDVAAGRGRVDVMDDGRLPAASEDLWDRLATPAGTHGHVLSSAVPAAPPVPAGGLERCGMDHPSDRLPYFRTDKNYKVEGPRHYAVAMGHSDRDVPMRPRDDKVELTILVRPRDGKGESFRYYAGAGAWPFDEIRAVTLRALDLHDPRPSFEQAVERENARLRSRWDAFMAKLAAMPDAELSAYATRKAEEEARYRQEVEDLKWDLVDQHDIDMDYIEFFSGMDEELNRRGLPEPERAPRRDEGAGFRP